MSSVSSTNSLSSKTGIGGLVSGMDTDELVKSLTTTSRAKILKQQQSLQQLQWKQTAYRSVTSALTQFQSKYLDVLSPTNFRSTSLFNTVKATSASTAISVQATSGAKEGSFTIDSITQLATNQTIKSSAAVSKALTGTLTAGTSETMTESDIQSLLEKISGKSLSINLDGQVKTITFNSTFIESVNQNLTSEGFAHAFQGAVDTAFGVKNPADRIINVSLTGNQLSLDADGSRVTIKAVGGDTNTLQALGFSDGQSNKITSGTQLSDLSLAAKLTDGSFGFSINGVNFNFNSTDTLSQVMEKINSSDAGVKISYSDISDKFTISSTKSGMGENIVMEETQGNLLSAMGITSASGAEVTYGKNAILSIDGKQISRSSNSISVNGVNVDLLSVPEAKDTPITVKMAMDSSSLLETVKKFVEEYNSMLNSVNTYLGESIYKDFPPLSDEQKADMTEKQIEQWEEKAKSGILRGDPLLKSLTSKLQTAMYASAEKGGISLYEMGIKTGGYGSNGKLEIDEEKLTKALKTRGAEISTLFTSEKGVANVLNNIIKEAANTTGAKGSRGTLVEMAGMPNTISDRQNNLTDQMSNIQKNIKSLQTRLTKEERSMWNKFTAMEQALSRLNAQSSILMQFSSNG